MKYRPSAIEEFLATLPEDLQVEALTAIALERDRIKNGPWTEEEVKFQKMVHDLAINARKTIEKVAYQIFMNQ